MKKKDGAYDIIMLLKYWKATIKGPLTVDNNGHFKHIDTLSHILLKNKDGNKILVKGVMNGSWTLTAVLFLISYSRDFLSITSGPSSITPTFPFSNKNAYIVTGLSDKTKIKNISCGYHFILLMSQYGRLYGLELN